MTIAALLLATLLAAVPAAADPFVDQIITVTVGEGGGAGSPALVLGPPRGAGPFRGSSHTLSLGLGGSIVIAFTDNVAVDGPGPDLTVFENAFLVSGLTTLPPYAEPGTVSVSADGVEWRTFPCALAEPPYYPGCAGVYPVFADADDPLAPSPLVPTTTPIDALVGVPLDTFPTPPGSGGDSFDLAAVGLRVARYVRIDASLIDRRLLGLSGFDLDAVAALHSVEIAGAPDADGDGIPDQADGCPSAADPAQGDGDGDGTGDACDRCPTAPDPEQQDRDADGIGDVCDNCLTTPNPDQRDGDGDGTTGDACTRSPGEPEPDTDGDGVPDAGDVCPATPDPSQADRDGDGVGDACDNDPGAPNPSQQDRDGDGAPDVTDPCPDDALCGPWRAGTFAGGGRRELDALLTFVEPGGRRQVVAAGTTAVQLTVAVSADVVPGSVRVRVQRRDVTASLPPFVPGSTRTVRLPVAGRRLRVELRAEGRERGARKRTDTDRLTFVLR